MKRVLVVVNKYWECDPVVNVLLNEYLRPPSLGWPTMMHQPRHRGVQGKPGDPLEPRLVYEYENSRTEIWCISDLLEGSDSSLQSSTEEKSKVLPKLYKSAPDLVIAMGTAGYPSMPGQVPLNRNGCVW